MNCLVTYIKCKFNVLYPHDRKLFTASMLIPMMFFKKQKGICSVLSFKREHQVFLFTGSGLQQNEGKFTRK